MRPDLTSWHADWSGERALVIGLDAPGFAAADTLRELGASVHALADETGEALEQILRVLAITQEPLGAAAPPSEAWLREFTVCVLTTEVGHELAAALREARLPVWSEPELAWRVADRFGERPAWVSISGESGKTLTQVLAASIARAGGILAAPCGAGGVPVLDAVRDPERFAALIVECSLADLAGLSLASPDLSLCLNAPTRTAASESAPQRSALAAQTDGASAYAPVYERTRDVTLYSAAAPETIALIEGADVVEGARAVGVTLGSPGLSELGIVDGILCDRAFHQERATSALELITLDELQRLGLASAGAVVDVLAACAIARGLGAPPEAVRAGLASLPGIPGRLELLGVTDGVQWVNDAHASTPHALGATLGSFASPLLVLATQGDEDATRLDLGTIAATFGDHLSGVVVVGDGALPEVAVHAFERHAPDLEVRTATGSDTGEALGRAVRLAGSLAGSGDTVVFATASGSPRDGETLAELSRAFTEAVRSAWEGEHASTEHHPQADGARGGATDGD